MKKIFSLVTLITAVVAVSTTANAQVTSPAVISGVIIVAPITIVKDVDLNFGNVAVSGTAGAVVLATDGTRTKSGGITLPNQAGSPTAAKFTVGGQDNYTYSIGLPTAAIELNGTGTNTTKMTLTSVVSLPATTGTLASGAQTLLVGGTLNVAGGQPADVYSNNTGLTVTVNYN
jgi:methionine-rich copper-binding protein CopC